MIPAAVWPLALLAARIAIVSSSSDAAGQATLRYPARDADRVAAVLGELGSFAPGDVWTLPKTSVATLREALDRAERRAAQEPGSEIFFYYSGHADPEGLLLGGERFAYRELRERLARSRAQVRVAVLDACNSGSATSPKGGKPGTGAPLPALAPVQVNGAVILAASGADEVAQESGDIDGSVFTHHLISGLRGAGDRDGNGVVTLGEAYAHVYARTLAATVPSLWGAQHPSYDYRLSGTGDLVLTTLRRGGQGIVFSSGRDGIYSVLDAGREVVGEVRVDAARAVRLALPAGRYRVALRTPGGVSATDISLTAGADVGVQPSMLERVNPAFALAKGGEPPPRNGAFADFALVGRGLATAGVSAEVGLGFRRTWDWTRWSIAPRLSYGETQPEVGSPFHLQRWGAAAYGLRRLTEGTFDLNLGAGFALTHVTQGTADGDARRAFIPGLAAVLALEIPLGRVLALRIWWDVGVELLPIDEKLRLRPETRAALGLGVRR
jgi:hypothetical protein